MRLNFAEFRPHRQRGEAEPASAGGAAGTRGDGPGKAAPPRATHALDARLPPIRLIRVNIIAPRLS